mmetsp:Transcript_1430/g.8793  ORF Transcript_1430/g.8793 Transcript_1430/m.8793 type:complete len:124 (-) Transcript_1430:147-518(-)
MRGSLCAQRQHWTLCGVLEKSSLQAKALGTCLSDWPRVLMAQRAFPWVVAGLFLHAPRKFKIFFWIKPTGSFACRVPLQVVVPSLDSYPVRVDLHQFFGIYSEETLVTALFWCWSVASSLPSR